MDVLIELNNVFALDGPSLWVEGFCRARVFGMFR